MKTQIGVGGRRLSPGAGSSVEAVVFALAVCWATAAPAQEADAAATSTKVAAAPTQPAATNQPTPAPVSPSVGEIVRMADAGVSVEVIKTYVETSPTAFHPSEADLIALKQHNVPDDVATLLLKRGAQARTVLAKSRNDALEHALSTKRMTAGGLDPESYDYFRYYYLQPRAMAAAYQRLSPYYNYSFRYPFRYRHTRGFGPPY